MPELCVELCGMESSRMTFLMSRRNFDLYCLPVVCVRGGKSNSESTPKDGKTMTTYLSNYCSFLPGGGWGREGGFFGMFCDSNHWNIFTQKLSASVWHLTIPFPLVIIWNKEYYADDILPCCSWDNKLRTLVCKSLYRHFSNRRFRASKNAAGWHLHLQNT